MRWIKFSLLFIAAIVVLILTKQVLLPLLKSNNSLLQIETTGVEARVYLNDEGKGETPFLGKKLPVGEVKLRLEAEINSPRSQKVVFSRTISLNTASLTSVNYDFGPDERLSSGDIRSKRVGEGLVVVTHPSKAVVFLNGLEVGGGPVSLFPSKGIHKLKISLAGYYSRELEIDVEPGKRSIVEVFLAINPFERVEKIQEGKINLYQMSTNNEWLASNPETWSKGVFFYGQTKNLSFDALIDFAGAVYYKDKSGFDKKINEGKSVVVGYLDNKESTGLASKAKESLSAITKSSSTVKTITKKVQITTTPTGFLNVRSGPNTGSSVVAKVNPGETYELLEEQPGWYKIKLSSGQGWISSQYAKKL
ncbi:MAG: hypothetical protein A3A57_00840 [Candidatus Woykebacteria bacterium RIFCSPLOWO2_01_FULL_41_12]|uniref:SH3b domain-containing protein n=1 Tax=Candidatus Woykebacteria bacterium RIFCSPLOWO2_01_FULL_41_12 TaxID=1802604 RepID=A0A1G1WSA0_9BACT|nr:MAG: hypothetical protein A3A57_00840 [Candidatus Woykebacteria bacterium RIFCSPLOWO2_01_FULL_41_12]